MTPVLSKRDRCAVVRYAMDRIDEALAQAWMREFCVAQGFSVRDIRGGNNRSVAMENRIKVAVYLYGRGFKRRVVAAVMNRHYDMIRYYTKPALRERKRVKNCLNAKRWRIPAENKVNRVLTCPPNRALY